MSRYLVGIDPGNVESGWVLIERESRRPLRFGKDPNGVLLTLLRRGGGYGLAVEMVASYGMPVGREVFDTCVWVGRFVEANEGLGQLILRPDVKLHHCNNRKAKDPNVVQALIDRFAPGVRNKGKGSKAEPGWFYGFAGDVWQAYAVAVCAADQEERAG